MKILDLFCGTKSISNAFARRGHEIFTVDWDRGFSPSLCADIGTLTAEDIIHLCGGVPDVIWASPDCTTYSVAAISHHRKRGANGERRRGTFTSRKTLRSAILLRGFPETAGTTSTELRRTEFP